MRKAALRRPTLLFLLTHRVVTLLVAASVVVMALARCATTAGLSGPTTAPTAPPLPATVTPTPQPSPTRPRATPTALPTPGVLGIHLLLDDGRNVWPIAAWPEHLAYARRLVGEWGYVVELIRADDLDPERWQVFMDLCAQLHLTPVLRLATTYDTTAHWWNAPAPDADGEYATAAGRYATFVSALRWPTATHPIIVGNEPNHGNEWGGTPDPAAYARFLIAVSDALHRADPGALVLNGGFDPYTPNTNGVPFVDGQSYMDEETFLDGMVAASPDVFTHLDVWASHAYPTGPLTEGPWQQTFRIDMINGAANPHHVAPPPGIANRGINGYAWELFKLATYGIDALPVMITETGWRHAESTDPTATDNGRPLPSASTVAAYFDLAFNGNHGRYPGYPEAGWTPWREDPRVIAVTPFAFDGYPAEWGHTNWLALDAQGAVIGVYAPFEAFATGKAQP